MPSPTPAVEARPQLYLKFQFASDKEEGVVELPEQGDTFNRFEYKAMANGGYIIKAKLIDPHSNLLRTMVDHGYFEESRVKPVRVLFQIKWGKGAQYPEKATKIITALVVTMRASGGPADIAFLDFVAIDPPSFYLSAGDAAGTSFRGRVSEVIKQVVARYAPSIKLDISQTTDSSENRFWMMRQDPKTFITSLTDWSSSITPLKTHWVITPGGVDGDRLTIIEQGKVRSRQRGFYRYHAGSGHDTIRNWSLSADNALSLSATKLVTAGLSAVSGRYLDQITDQKEEIVFAKDLTTEHKQTAWVDIAESFTRPGDGRPPEIPVAGWTAIPAIPELYSAGDLGRRYDEYIDGRARGDYLNLNNLLFRARFEVVGHGIWSDCEGLGADTFFVRWLAPKNVPYFLTGNWLCYGFHHVVTRKFWTTNLYGARFDWDAESNIVGASLGANYE